MRDLTEFLSLKYREILERGHTHEDFLYDIFNALEAVPNPNFSARIRDESQKWELGGLKTADAVMPEALTLCNNAISTN